MKFRNIFIFGFLILLVSCEQKGLNNTSKLNLKLEKKYKNIGFSLIYNNNLNLKKLDNDSLQIFHKNLNNKSLVKISNPLNGKTLIAEVKSNRVKFSNFYNSIITNKIAEMLELNSNEPYIEITLVSKHSTFVAKKAKTFEEEKEVAEKAPIDGIKISNLNNISKNKNKKILNDKFSYSIKVADFYYKKTAKIMIDRIKLETSLKDIRLIELTKTNFRVLIGPFNDIKSLKDSFEKMNSLYFENLEILKND
jgi:hypothetical protein|tara:strand:- start:1774 stop:2526 length:753 start_codon:yes stop_codon:yes gene_type:complete